ncbi:MAG: hypothetical protein EPN82_13865 [Bacteroidetes bacterium]|nr:MAG: hypothetical protein EPN82_13865 [Bacteroidota bacterium]
MNITIKIYMTNGQVCQYTDSIKCACDCDYIKANLDKIIITADPTQKDSNGCEYAIYVKNLLDCKLNNVNYTVVPSDNQWGTKDFGTGKTLLATVQVPLNEPVIVYVRLEFPDCDSIIKTFTLNCDSNCCDNIVSFGPPISVADPLDSNRCCFKIPFVIDGNCIHDAWVDYDSTSIRIYYVNQGANDFTICIDKSDYQNIDDLPVFVYFRNNAHDTVCTKTTSIHIASCCTCDTLDNQFWLTVNTLKDPACPDSGCKVTMFLDLPDTITCFKYFVFENTSGQKDPPALITGDTMTIEGPCIGSGESGQIVLYLLKQPNESPETACHIIKNVFCDSLPFAPPCPPPDCPDDKFIGPIWSYPIHLGNGCDIIVQYAYRIACPERKQDLFILAIKQGIHCLTITKEEMYQAALEYLLKYDPMGFEPLPDHFDTCAYTWRLGIIDCWRNVAYYPPPACPDSNCCWQEMYVCRDASGGFSYGPQQPLRMYLPANGCDTLPGGHIPPPDDKCYFVCDWITKSGNVAPMNEVYFPLEVIDSSSENSKFTVKYYDGYLNVYLKSECGAQIRVDISDVYGIKWLSSEQQSRAEKMIFKIDIRNFGKGFYVYKIYCNENYIGNGKFIIE